MRECNSLTVRFSVQKVGSQNIHNQPIIQHLTKVTSDSSLLPHDHFWNLRPFGATAVDRGIASNGGMGFRAECRLQPEHLQQLVFLPVPIPP